MISLKNVSKYYTSGDKVTMALNNINLTLDDVGFVAITGESGSGKSTLLNVISGMDTYEEGEVYYGEQETSYFDELDWENYRRNNVSIIYQLYNLIDSYSVYDNIATILKMNGDLSDEEIDKRTKEALDKVGILKQARKKACHLSSGQKQRLGIARALAKDTNIIIADEPTGNLDVENGKAVMAILHELSKDRLVVVVTHNYEQAEEFCDRKIRLFDGKIAEDVTINSLEDKKLEEDKLLLKQDEEKKSSILKKSVLLARKNVFAQPRRMFFNFVLIFFFAFASFLFLGTLAGSVDDTMTKFISKEHFSNVDKTRILVKRVDGEVITEDDIKALSDIKYINEVDMYDNSADISFHYQANIDYVANVEYKKHTKKNEKVVTFMETDNFVKSSYCISEDDLAYGRLPEKYDEIVIYDTGDDRLDKDLEIYFSNTKWGRSDYGYINAKIVGILKEETEQIYFAKELVYSLNTNLTDLDVTLDIVKTKVVDYDDPTVDDYISSSDETVYGDLIINDDLADNEVRISQNYFYRLYNGDQSNISEGYDEDSFLITKMTISSKDKEYETKEMELKLSQAGSGSSDGIIEVNTNTFNKVILQADHTQCSIYVDDYAYVSRVLDSLYDYGYEGVSIFNISALEYNEELLTERMRTLLLTGVALVVVFVLSIFVIFAMLKMKTKDLLIMKGLGVKKAIINRSNYLYNYILAIFAAIVVVIAMNVMANIGIEVIRNSTKYMTITYYLVWGALTVLVSTLSAKLFNRSLDKKYN